MLTNMKMIGGVFFLRKKIKVFPIIKYILYTVEMGMKK